VEAKKKICASVFLDVQQAFDRVWHGLLYKLKSKLPDQLYLVLKSSRRTILSKSQGSVIGPLLYLIYTTDAPTRDDTLTAKFTDDTAILSSDADPARGSERLHHHLNLLQN
jgi:hypothetical protein